MKRGQTPSATAAELALVGIAAVWGLTFTMVQDAIAVLPAMTFLAYLGMFYGEAAE